MQFLNILARGGQAAESLNTFDFIRICRGQGLNCENFKAVGVRSVLRVDYSHCLV
jgi:hypothetical protein